MEHHKYHTRVFGEGKLGQILRALDLVRENVCSVTTDGRGHIFISDPKNCVVSLFSSDGVELSTVMDLRDIGRPGPICWCESLLSLIVAYEMNGKWAIVVVDLRTII